MNKPRWVAAQDKILRKHWGLAIDTDAIIFQISQAGPPRTYAACCLRAEQLGIRAMENPNLIGLAEAAHMLQVSPRRLAAALRRRGHEVMGRRPRMITVATFQAAHKIYPMLTPQHLTVKAVCSRIKHSDTKIVRDCRTGKIPGAIQHGESWYVPEGYVKQKEEEQRGRNR